MGEASHTLDHAAQAYARLPDRLKTVDGVTALQAILVKQVQALEDAAFDVLTKRFLDGEGVQLDTLGKLLAEPRAGFGDDDYLQRLKAKIVVLRSSGTMPNLIKVFKLLLPANNIRFTAYGGAGFILDIGIIDAAFAAIYARFLHDAKSAGINGQLVFTVAPDADTFSIDVGSALTAGAILGATALVVADGTQFVAGDLVCIASGSIPSQLALVSSVVVNTVNLASALATAQDAGTAVSVLARVGSYAAITTATAGAVTTLQLASGHPFSVNDSILIDPAPGTTLVNKQERRDVSAVTATSVSFLAALTLSHALGAFVTHTPHTGFGDTVDPIVGGKLSGTIT